MVHGTISQDRVCSTEANSRTPPSVKCVRSLLGFCEAFASLPPRAMMIVSR